MMEFKRLIVKIFDFDEATQDWSNERIMIDSINTDFVHAYNDDDETKYCLSDEIKCMRHFCDLAEIDSAVFSGSDACDVIERETGKIIYSLAHWYESEGRTYVIQANVYQS